MEVLSPSLKKLWNEWQLRALVLLSLTLQIILILLGNRRKYTPKIIVWPAYLAADFVATAALGVLVSNLFSHSGTLDPNLQLQAFWAPFLLLHLGGPDTITAYSVEDNELSSRHLLQVIFQTGVAFYILLMAWTGSHISILTMPMILAGLIKYGERTWALWSASSSEQRRALKPSSQNTVQVLFDDEDHSEAELLQVAYGMFNMAKHLFAGLPIPATKQSATANHWKSTYNKNAFEVTEMQLGFMYDFLYTKALVTYTPSGIALRFTTVAILLELYAALLLLLSDHTVAWLKKHNRNNISQAITSLSLPRNPSWSKSMGQFSFLSYFLNEKPMDFEGILKLLKINEKLEKQGYVAYREVPEDLRKRLITGSRKYRERLETFSSNLSGKRILEHFGGSLVLVGLESNYDTLHRTITMGFQQTILVWHIATELSYHLDRDYFTKKNQETKCISAENVQGKAENTAALNRKMSKLISRYMMYLLAISPDSLPGSEALGLTSFQHTHDVARKGLVELQRLSTEKERKRQIKIQASKLLVEQYTDLQNLEAIKNGLFCKTN
ncbi:unnamed protein product [Dovyalis caffra]|uniref:DUF4220 domain-containing protein n=1 Tax=Dovyalis caffra TaxID=77055 RepID=A0AAV1QTP8_9ROSI|nr:unnamed protein product [Dovyalis caffra]